MRKPLSVLTLFVLLIAAQFQASVAQKDDGARLVNQVSAISAGADTKARGTAIKKRLDELGILSFIRANVETLSFSLIDGKEIPSILKVFNREMPDQMPRVLSIIHSPNDTPDKVDGTAIARALPVVEQAIRLMDK